MDVFLEGNVYLLMKDANGSMWTVRFFVELILHIYMYVYIHIPQLFGCISCGVGCAF